MLQNATAPVKFAPANLTLKVVILSLPKYLLQSRLTFNLVKPCHIERSRDTYKVG
jgi:hypothetical protein